MKHIVLAFVAFLMPTSLLAASLDFSTLPYQPPERSVANGTAVMDSIGGVDFNVIFSATGGLAYFDGLSGGRPAGLGVCDDRNNPTGGTECARSGDDNIQSGEAAFVKFETLAGKAATGDVDGAILRRADHRLLANKTIEFSLDGGTSWMEGLTDGSGFLNFDALPGMGKFTTDGLGFRYGGSMADEFYVNILGTTDGPGVNVSPVPVPAAFGLLLAALGGLFGVKRWKSRETAVA